MASAGENSPVRNTQQSSDMVERVARAINARRFGHEGANVATDGLSRDIAISALEASHHADCVRELKNASWLLANIDPDGLVKRQIDTLLAKIGSDDAPHHERVSGSPSPGKARFEIGGDA